MARPYENCGIYKISCSANGKVYIGSSTQIKRRFYLHKRDMTLGRHHSQLMQRSWIKYGEESFQFEPILFCKKEDLLVYEQNFMDFYDAYNPAKGMNISKLAGRPTNKCTEEHKVRMRLERTGKPIFKNNPEAHANMMAAVKRGQDHPMYGKEHTDEAKRKISIMNSKRSSWNKGIPSDRKGKPRSDEIKAKISASRKAAGHTVITMEIAIEIRSLAASDTMSRREIAEKFGIKQTLVNAVVQDKCWREND